MVSRAVSQADPLVVYRMGLIMYCIVINAASLVTAYGRVRHKRRLITIGGYIAAMEFGLITAASYLLNRNYLLVAGTGIVLVLGLPELYTLHFQRKRRLVVKHRPRR